MIRRITDGNELKTSGNYYGGKIRSYREAYGTGYDFCRFYGDENGCGFILIYNMNMVIEGTFSDPEELSHFIGISAPATIECTENISALIALKEYAPVKRTLFEMKKSDKYHDEINPVKNERLSEISRIISTSFEGAAEDLWYTDTSHRIRHGVSESYLYEKSTACIDFVSHGRAYLSSIATMPEARGQHKCARLLDHICRDLEKRDMTGFLWCLEELEPFYMKMGFEINDTDIFYIMKET